LEHIEAACSIVEWHLYESKRFFSQIATPAHVNNAVKLDDYILRYCRDKNSAIIGRSFLMQHSPVRDSKVLTAAISELADANRVRVFTEGRASMIEVNPELLGSE
jgi:putative DNA primase/helicase